MHAAHKRYLAEINFTLDGPASADCLARALAALPDPERQVLEWYFGLAGDAPMTLDAIAERLGCPSEWVRRVKEDAIEMLRGPLRVQLIMAHARN